MPEYDYIRLGEFDDPVLGVVKYSITQTINAICPNCGNPDCQEIEEFKERLKQLWKESSNEPHPNPLLQFT